MKDAEDTYKSWSAYADAEFGGGFHISASRHDRPAIVAALHDAGASQTLISNIVNTTRQTVANDIDLVESERAEATKGANNLPPSTDTPLADDNIIDADTVDYPQPEDSPPSSNGEATAASTTSIGADNKEDPRATTRPR